MNTKINCKNLKIFATAFIAAFIFISVLGAGLATAGVISKLSTGLSGFLPLIFSKPADVVPVTSTGVLIVFSSQATTDGNAGGRPAMNEICMSQDLASHFCSLEEIETAWKERGVSYQSPFLRSWVDNPILGGGLGAWEYDSCMGWTSNDGVHDQGTWIDNNAIDAYRRNQYGPFCNEIHPITCCKLAP